MSGNVPSASGRSFAHTQVFIRSSNPAGNDVQNAIRHIARRTLTLLARFERMQSKHKPYRDDLIFPTGISEFKKSTTPGRYRRSAGSATWGHPAR